MQRDGGNIKVYASETIFPQNHILEIFNKCSSPPSLASLYPQEGLCSYNFQK